MHDMVTKETFVLGWKNKGLVQVKDSEHERDISRVFPKLYKVGNVVNKGLSKEEQNKFRKKNCL